MSKELTKQETTALSTEFAGTWGSEGIDNEDIVLPKILLMQAMSEAVSEKEIADAGDIIKSTTETVVGGRDKPLKIIPISTTKTWVLMQKEGSRYEFKGIEPVTPQNANRPLEWSDELKNDWRADKCLNFYVLLQSEVAPALKGEGACIPCVISFRRTSYMAGRKLASGIAESRFMNQPAFSRTYNLRVEKKTNDLGTYYVFDVVPDGKATLDEMRYAKQWFENLNSSQVKVHETTDE